MAPFTRRLLLGREPPGSRRAFWSLSAAVLFLGTFAAYAVGVFAVSGCVVFIPGHAAIVGFGAALLAGYERGGLALAWLVAYAPLLGASADHYLLGLSSRPFAARLEAFFGLDGLAFLGVEALVIGTVAFALGAFVGWGFELVRGGSAVTDRP
jgi:hypothetical protein